MSSLGSHVSERAFNFPLIIYYSFRVFLFEQELRNIYFCSKEAVRSSSWSVFHNIQCKYVKRTVHIVFLRKTNLHTYVGNYSVHITRIFSGVWIFFFDFSPFWVDVCVLSVGPCLEEPDLVNDNEQSGFVC